MQRLNKYATKTKVSSILGADWVFVVFGLDILGQVWGLLHCFLVNIKAIIGPLSAGLWTQYVSVHFKLLFRLNVVA